MFQHPFRAFEIYTGVKYRRGETWGILIRIQMFFELGSIISSSRTEEVGCVNDQPLDWVCVGRTRTRLVFLFCSSSPWLKKSFPPYSDMHSTSYPPHTIAPENTAGTTWCQKRENTTPPTNVRAPFPTKTDVRHIKSSTGGEVTTTSLHLASVGRHTGPVFKHTTTFAPSMKRRYTCIRERSRFIVWYLARTAIRPTSHNYPLVTEPVHS